MIENKQMKIWVDADACPRDIKDILFRVAERKKIKVILVANNWIRVPEYEFIEFIMVSQGADIADDKIAESCVDGDIVITADIPLAARVVEAGAIALDPRGKIYNKNNIGQVLGMRNFMDELRGSGVETGGPSSFSKKHGNQFANELDKLITKI